MKKAFEVVVVGAGAAGIAAAVSVAQCGRRVALIDDNPMPGGQIWRSGAALTASAREWLSKLENSAVERIAGARVFDHPAPGVLYAERDEESIELCCERMILATGARELFRPFPGWTLPGVFGAGGLDAMARGGLPVSGKKVVVAGTGPLLLAVAVHLAARGADVVDLCEQAPLARMAAFAAGMLAQPNKLLQGMGYALAARGARLHFGCWPVAARGAERLESVILRQGTREWSVAADFLACGFHLVPNSELALLAGCSVEKGFVVTDELQRTSVERVFCAGEPVGIGGVDLALAEGQIAGLAAAGRTGEARRLVPKRQRMSGFIDSLRTAFSLDPQLRRLPSDHTIVCRCEDVRYGALREHTTWRGARLQTRCGMGPCQGRVCGAAAEFLFGWGTDAVRPPLFPVLVSSLAALPESERRDA